MPGRAITIAATSALVSLAGFVAAAEKPGINRAEINRGWLTLRTMDCARCHGRDYEGWTAPSLIASVRDSTRERFDRYVLDGDIGRGMPGYRTQPAVTANLDAIYAYLRARAQGDVGPGKPDDSPQHPVK